jgi:hypothetical protein
MKGYIHLKVVFPLRFSGQPITLQNEIRSITLDVTRSNRATLPSLRTRADSIFPFILPASKNLRRIIVKVLTGEMEQFGSIQLITRNVGLIPARVQLLTGADLFTWEDPTGATLQLAGARFYV